MFPRILGNYKPPEGSQSIKGYPSLFRYPTWFLSGVSLNYLLHFGTPLHLCLPSKDVKMRNPSSRFIFQFTFSGMHFAQSGHPGPLRFRVIWFIFPWILGNYEVSEV